MRALIALALFTLLSGCSTYRVMKDCHPLNEQDELLKGYSACMEQWKIFR